MRLVCAVHDELFGDFKFFKKIFYLIYFAIMNRIFHTMRKYELFNCCAFVAVIKPLCVDLWKFKFFFGIYIGVTVIILVTHVAVLFYTFNLGLRTHGPIQWLQMPACTHLSGGF